MQGHTPEQHSHADQLTELAYERLPEMSAIIRAISKKPETNIIIGSIEGGSFANLDTHETTLDPVHIGNSIEEARFVAGHEAMHHRITPHPVKDIPLPKERVEALYSKLGFGYAQNVVEDMAVNTRLSSEYEAHREYGEMVFADPEEILAAITPEVLQLMGLAGKDELPLFAQFGTALMRKWSHGTSGKYGADNPAIEQSVARVWPLIESMLERDLPSLSEPDERVLQAGIDRWRLIADYIWPYFTEFIEADIEKLKSALEAQSSEPSNNQDIEAEAIEILKSIEDILNGQLRPVKQVDNPSTTSHAERSDLQSRLKEQVAAEDAKAEEEALRAKLIDAKRRENLDPTEALIDDIPDMARILARRLMRILGRTEFETATYGLPSGQFIDMRAAMQYEANPNVTSPRIFGRLVEPTQRDWRGIMLGDCSGSMGSMSSENNEKFREMMRALAVFTRTASIVEASNNELNRILFALGQFGIDGSASLFKTFESRNYWEVQRGLGVLLATDTSNNGTPMEAGTKLATDTFAKSPGKSGNILCTVSDGAPNNDELQIKALEELRRKVPKVLAILIRIEKEVTPQTATHDAARLGFDEGIAIPSTAGISGLTLASEVSRILEKKLAS